MVKTSCCGKTVLFWVLCWIYIKLNLQSICEYLSGHFCWGIKGGKMRCLTHQWLFCLWLQKLVPFNYVNLICQLGLAWMFNLAKLQSTTSPPELHLFINSRNNQNCYWSFFKIPFHNSSLIWNLEIIIQSFSSWIVILKHLYKPNLIFFLLLFFGAFFLAFFCFTTFSAICSLSHFGDRGHTFCWCLIASSTGY